MQVTALEKPVQVPCKHLAKAPAKGCSIYEYRPPECRDWKCAWLKGWTPTEDRPDRLGLVFDLRTGNDTKDGQPCWVAYKVPGMMLDVYARGLLRHMTQMALVQYIEGPDLEDLYYSGPGELVRKVVDSAAKNGYRIKLKTF
jgi:hypothetical protein